MVKAAGPGGSGRSDARNGTSARDGCPGSEIRARAPIAAPTTMVIPATITAGLVSSLGWLMLSGPAFQNVYGMKTHPGLVPFSQPGILTIPLGFAVLVAVSLMTQPHRGEDS